MQKDLVFLRIGTKYTGSKYAIGVANATDGLQMCLWQGVLKLEMK